MKTGRDLESSDNMTKKDYLWGHGQGEQEADEGNQVRMPPGFSVRQQEPSGAINQNKHFRRKNRF